MPKEKFEMGNKPATEGEKFRDDLAKKIKEIRDSSPDGKALAWGYLTRAREEEEYQSAKATHTDEVAKSHETWSERYNRERKEKNDTQKKEREEVSPDHAKEIMGDGFFCGAEKVEEIWGIELKDLPPVPFTELVLERAREQRMFLEYVPTLEEKLSSPKALAEVVGKRYGQIKKERFPGADMPDDEYKILGPLDAGGPEMSWSDDGQFLDKQLAVNEKVEGGWRLVQTIPLPGSFSIGETAKIEQNINIRRFVSELLRDTLSENSKHKLGYRLRQEGAVDDFKESATEAYFRMVNQKRLGMKVTPAWTSSRFRNDDDFMVAESQRYKTVSPSREFDMYLRLNASGYRVSPEALGDTISTDTMYGDHIDYSFPPTTVVIKGDWFKELEQTR